MTPSTKPVSLALSSIVRVRGSAPAVKSGLQAGTDPGSDAIRRVKFDSTTP